MDRPKDKTTAADAPRAPAATRAFGASEVAHYLRQHPDFLVENPELLDVLTPPALHRGERIADRAAAQHQSRKAHDIEQRQSDARKILDLARGDA